MTALYIICAIVLLLVILFAVPIKAKLRFSYNENEGEITLHYLFLKFYVLPKKAKPQKQKKEKQDSESGEALQKTAKKRDIKQYIKLIGESLPDIKKCLTELLDYIFKKFITVSKLDLSIHFGLDDAMYTGMGTGAIYTAVYSVTEKLKQNNKLKSCNINIEPDFEVSNISAKVCAVLETNMFRIFVILGIIIRLFVKLFIRFLINKRRLKQYE